MKYKIRRIRHEDFLPWQILNPKGEHVWRSQHHHQAMSVADVFARRDALHRDLQENGR